MSKRIALIAHDNMKPTMIEWCQKNKEILSHHFLCGTGTTARMITDKTGLPVRGYNSGPLGGDQQIGALVACNEIDMLLLFGDPLNPKEQEPKINNLLRLCDVHNVPVATNIATAEVLVRALDHGDLDWREIVNPSSSLNKNKRVHY